MSVSLKRALNVREGEGRLVALFSLVLLANTASRQLSGIVGISSLINVGGINDVLIVDAINGALIIVTAAASSLIVDRFNRVKLLYGTALAFLGFFVLLAILRQLNVSDRVTDSLMFLVSQQQWLVFPMFFWVLITDLLDTAQARRLIPVIGSWTFIGKIIGIGAALVPPLLIPLLGGGSAVLSVDDVIRINGVVYLGLAILILLTLRRTPVRQVSSQREDIRKVLTEGRDFVKEVPSFRYLQAAVMMVGVCDVIVEFRFFVVAKSAIPDPAAYQQYYSYYLLGAAVVSFFLQFFLTSRLIQKIQLKNSFLIQPSIALGASVAMLLLGTSLIGSSLVSNLMKISRNTVDEATSKSFQALIPEERRGRVALLMNNYTPAFGYILGSIVAGAVVYGNSAGNGAWVGYAYLGISAVAGAFAVLSIVRMRQTYDDSLFNWRLKRRRRASAVLKRLEF